MSDFSPEAIYKQLLSSSQEWAKADEEARKLKEMDKIVLAEITNQTEGDSYADRKSRALASAEYKLHKEKMIAAKTAANVAMAKYKAMQSLAEMRRTQESTRRAEAFQR